MAPAQKGRAVPAIPQSALDAVKDANVRQVLQALADAHHVRNGAAGNGDNRFVTAAEVGLTGGRTTLVAPQNAGAPPAAGPGNHIAPGAIARIINDLQTQVFESPLFKRLGERIGLIDAPGGTVALLAQELDDELLKVNDGITQINTIESTSTSASARTLAATKATAANAMAGVIAIDDVSATSTSANARKLAGLDAAFANPTTGLYSRALAVDVANAFADAGTATASRESAIYSAIGVKTRTYYQSSAPAGTTAVPLVAGDVWYDLDDNNTSYRWSGTAWVKMVDTNGVVNAAVATESATRVNQDNSIASAISTVWAALGGNSGLIQGGTSVTVNTAGAAATKWNQVQAALKDASGNIISSAAIKQTADASLDKAGNLELKWVVNMDAGGLATGFRQAGFGIVGSAAQAGPQYAFGVRADEFWIASPNDSGLTTPPTAKIPFIVTTAGRTVGGVYSPPGVYMKAAFIENGSVGEAQIGNAAIKSAKIGDAEIGTLKIGKDAVTVPFANTFPGTTYGNGTWVVVASGQITLTQPGMVYAATTGVIYYTAGWIEGATRLKIDGVEVSEGHGNSSQWLNAAHSGGLKCPAKTVLVTLEFKGDTDIVSIVKPTLFIQGAMR